MVGCYFHRRKALAYGIAMSGSGIGTFVLAPAVQLLIELYSWRGALLVLSAFVANLCVCGALLQPITLQEDEEETEGELGESAREERLGEEQTVVAEAQIHSAASTPGGTITKYIMATLQSSLTLHKHPESP